MPPKGIKIGKDFMERLKEIDKELKQELKELDEMKNRQETNENHRSNFRLCKPETRRSM